ncbi:type II toxin-antitoxin system RelE/ParE family toxin [Methylobacterium currus]|uniref:type II toxin-antitoxin system RelE/ParE family toxin n=1 Tax=Methylobacterium currus TaxID=2051553 RepID=UPI0013DF41CE|nr:type II toxin-antitoxin system RelE/ParE family toxin [Methylobacterium currus]
MKRVVISAPAAQNLRDIGDYIATDSPARARRFVAAPKERRLRLALHPFRGKPARDTGLDVRMLIAGNDLILYRVQAGIVMIDRIIHGSRDIAGHDDDL